MSCERARAGARVDRESALSRAESPLSVLAATDQPVTSRGRRTRSALIQAAREIFEEDGFEQARIADISLRARTSYGSFYRYFDSKHAIFKEVVKAATGEMFTASRSGVEPGAGPVEHIYDSTQRYLAAYARNAKIMHVIEQVSPRDDYFRGLLLEIRAAFVRRIAVRIQRLQADGLAASDTDAEIAASALGGMVEHFARIWFLFGQQFDEDTAMDTLTVLWARAIGLDVPAGWHGPRG